MKVQALMTRDVKTCTPSDSLNRAAQLMWDNDCGCIPVTDESAHVVGMITDRDVCMAAYTQGAALRDLQVSGAMAKKVLSCRPNDTIGEAETIMGVNQVRRLPVTEADGRLVRILSLNDVAREAEHERVQKGARQVTGDEVAATLGTVCQPRVTREITAAA